MPRSPLRLRQKRSMTAMEPYCPMAPKALANAERAERLSEDGRRELRPLVTDEVPRSAVLPHRPFEDIEDLACRGLAAEDAKGQGKP